MTQIHGYASIAVLGLTLVVGIWGVVSWIARHPSVLFWHLLRAAQVVIVVEVTLGALLLVGAHKPLEDLHIVYGLLPMAVMFIAEAMRVGVAARETDDVDIHTLESAEQRAIAMRIVWREMGIMAIAALLAFALALRAAMTAGYL